MSFKVSEEEEEEREKSPYLVRKWNREEEDLGCHIRDTKTELFRNPKFTFLNYPLLRTTILISLAS